MRKLFTVLTAIALMAACFILLPTTAQATTILDSGTCGEGLTWTLDDTGTLTISGSGSMSDYHSNGYGIYSPWYSIKELVRKVVIEKGITYIGREAFYNCDMITEIIIPEGVTKIGWSAFSSCDSLTKITIPSTLEHVQPWAFSRCKNLSDVYISDLESWCRINFEKYSAVENCPMYYADNLYLNGTLLTGVLEIPEGISSITSYAFKGSNITHVIIPASVQSIGDHAFDKCKTLESYSISSENPSYSAKDGILYNKSQTKLIDAPEGLKGSISLPSSLIFINDCAFSGCSSIASVSIPDSVMNIGDSAFYNCSNLTEIALSKNITTISDDMFAHCYSLKEVVIPEGVVSISRCAFEGCTNLASISIPSTVTKIGGAVLAHCENLWHILYGGTQTQWASIDIYKDSCITSDGSYKYNDNLVPSHYNYSGNAEIDIENRRCSICIAECPHNWNNGSVTKQATCKEEGKNTFTCTICSATKTETIAKTTTHSYGNWVKVNDTTHKHTCSVCSKEETANHIWNSGTVTKQPTCKEEGVKTFTCSACNGTKTEPVAKTTDHKFGSWTKGNDTTHKHTCSVCSKEETANHTWNSGAVTKKATCKGEGVKTYTCTACNATKTESIAKLTTHTYDHACDTDCNVCGLTRTTTHKYKTSWSKDKTNHWHECSVCKDKKDVATHTPGAEATETTAQTCATCGYVIKPVLGHKHDYANTWTTDADGHWHACSGCEEKDSYAAHDFENACDKDCSICGYTRETAHNYSEDWKSDKDNHWYECAGCGAKADEAAHEPGAEATETTAQTCTICGYEIAPALGVKDTEPTIPVIPTEPTTPVVPTKSAGDSEPSADPTVWIAVAVAVVVLGGGAGTGIIIWKKKH